jgi:hypothetical protein
MLLVPIANLMTLIETIKADYERFPANQSYDIYAEDVYFKDPLTEFRGLQRYQSLIDFISTWFKDINLELHDIRQEKNTIYTEWTLNWTTPFPWQPRISIPGWSELKFNAEEKIISHIDYWHFSRWEVIKQHFPR